MGNHRYICMGSGTKKILVNEKTPEITGEEMQQAYDESDLIKKVLKEDFRKRNRKHRKKEEEHKPNKNGNNGTKRSIINIHDSIYNDEVHRRSGDKSTKRKNNKSRCEVRK